MSTIARFGPDAYHLNFNDGPLPIDHLKADPRIGFVILKLSEGLSYSVGWAQREGARVRTAGLVLGLYHFLRWDQDGAAQWRYFRENAKLQPGDIVPIVDYEGGGPTHPNRRTPAATAKANLQAFIRAAHADKFPIMLYGHADVVAHFGDWKATGADYSWVPGSTPHFVDAALWQYAPYTAPAGFPLHPFGLAREDVSVIRTSLPVIPVPKPPAYREIAVVTFGGKSRGFAGVFPIRSATRYARSVLRAANVKASGKPAEAMIEVRRAPK